MKSISKFYFTISFIILLLLLGSIWYFSQESDRDKLQELRRFTVANFEQEFNRERDDLLKFSFALSEKSALKEVLENGNQKEAYELLYRISNKYKVDTGIEQLRLQLITNDLKIFAENWKSDNIGKELKGFRKDLIELSKNQKAKVGIETGRRLTFKATIPINSKGNIIGYLEVIQFIDELVVKLRQQGIELFVLMDKEYIIDDSLMKEFPYLKNYVIANENYDNRLKGKAESFSWKKLERLGHYEHNGRLFMLKDMKNGEKNTIGKYLMILRKNMLIAYKSEYQDISIITRFSDKDIDTHVNYSESSAKSYRTFLDREVIEIFPNLYKNDINKAFIKEAAKGILQEYTKAELIDIILENNHKEEKRGVIK
jgi:hypothetical protein